MQHFIDLSLVDLSAFIPKHRPLCSKNFIHWAISSTPTFILILELYEIFVNVFWLVTQVGLKLAILLPQSCPPTWHYRHETLSLGTVFLYASVSHVCAFKLYLFVYGCECHHHAHVRRLKNVLWELVPLLY